MWTEYVTSEGQVQWMLSPRRAALADLGGLPPNRRDWSSFLDRLPAEIRRYRKLGIHSASSAVAVQSTERLNETATTARVELSNQTGFGNIRYTTDVSPVPPSPTPYHYPLKLTLSAHLRA